MRTCGWGSPKILKVSRVDRAACQCSLPESLYDYVPICPVGRETTDRFVEGRTGFPENRGGTFFVREGRGRVAMR